MDFSGSEADLIRRLQALLSPTELAYLVVALEAVFLTHNGYGTVQVEVEHRRVKMITISSKIKPGVI